MTGIPVSKTQNGRLTIDESHKVDESVKLLEHIPLYVNNARSLPMSELEAVIKKMVNEHGVKIVIIDDMRLVKGFNVSSLDNFATDLDIFLICIYKKHSKALLNS